MAFGLQIIGTKGIIDFRIDKEPVAHILKGNPFNPDTQEIDAGTVSTGSAGVLFCVGTHWKPITTSGIIAGNNQEEPIANLGADLAAHLVAGRDLVAAIRENRAPLVSAHDARLTIEMVCAVFESHRLNGQRVTWPLMTRTNPLAQL